MTRSGVALNRHIHYMVTRALFVRLWKLGSAAGTRSNVIETGKLFTVCKELGLETVLFPDQRRHFFDDANSRSKIDIIHVKM